MEKTPMRSIFLTVHLKGDFSSFELDSDEGLTTPRPNAKFSATGVGLENRQLLLDVLRALEKAYGASSSVDFSIKGTTIIGA